MISVNTNTLALGAQEEIRQTTMDLDQSITRLSSGKRVNSAKDDPSGYAVNELMTTRVEGLDQATRNAMEAITMSQTIESAVTQLLDMENRLRRVSVQAANDTITDEQRTNLQKEVDQITREISRVVQQTEFNGVNVFTDAPPGDDALEFNYYISFGKYDDPYRQGPSRGTASGRPAPSQPVRPEPVSPELVLPGKTPETGGGVRGSGFEPVKPRLLQPVGPGSYDGPPPYTEEIANSGRGGTDRREVRRENQADNRIDRRYTRQQGKLDRKENRQKNMSSAADRAANLPVTQNVALRAEYRVDNVRNRLDNVQNNGQNRRDNAQNRVGARYDNGIGQRVAETQYRQDTRKAEAQYRQDTRQGARAQRFDARNARFSGGVLGSGYQREPILNRPIFNTSGGGVRSEVSMNGPASDAVRSADVKAAVSGPLRGTSSSNNTLRHDTNVAVLRIYNLTEGAYKLNLYTPDIGFDYGRNPVVDVTTQEAAIESIKKIDQDIEILAGQRSELGALELRMEYAAANNVRYENDLRNARSRIMDADFAEEATALTRAQILQQSGIAALAQANMTPQAALLLVQS